MQAELAELWLRRRDVVKALADAAAEGDRSENAEYIYRKKELAGIDRRIRYLQKRLPLLKVIPPRTGTADRVFFGAWVRVRDGDRVAVYRIVGADEIDPGAGAISVDSPLAKLLLGQTVGHRFALPNEDGATSLVIDAICFDGPPP